MRWIPFVALAACQAPQNVPTPPPAVGEDAVQTCDQTGLDVGDCAPDFQLLNADGTPIRLADKVGESDSSWSVRPSGEAAAGPWSRDSTNGSMTRPTMSPSSTSSSRM